MTDNKNYIVLARKYRPQKLSDLIGQEEICKVLEGSIKLKRVAQAYLFSGTRGVGKTTIARILAKIVNCISEINDNDKPCGKCQSCTSIDKESNLDVIEIDAASKTGVSDVREIIENINYKPVSAKKKIYIVDEVHMLSRAAFNALLKTLEEPPMDVIFIFATTETEKVPVTILSRCQRFQLRRVEVDVISQHLVSISKKEGFCLDAESSKLISQCSEGSVRDALSILDNVLSRGKEINITLVRDVLGLSDTTIVVDLFSHLCEGDVKVSLQKFDDLYQKGVSIDLLAKSLMNFIYHTARIKSEIDENYQFIDSHNLIKIKKISEKLDMDFIVRFWELMQKYVNEISSSFDEKQCFEMVIIRLCYVAILPTPFDLLVENNQAFGVENLPAKNFEKEPKTIRRTEKKIERFENNLAKKEFESNDSQIYENLPNYESDIEHFSKLVKKIEEKSEMLISYHLKNSFRLVKIIEPISEKKIGRIELENISSEVNEKEILWQTSKLLENITNFRWIISISKKRGAKSINEYEIEQERNIVKKIKENKLIKKILEIIPESEVLSIKKQNLAETLKEKE